MEAPETVATEAERRILASILSCNSSSVSWPNKVFAHYFQDTSNKCVFDAIAKVYDAGIIPDKLLVQAHLLKSGVDHNYLDADYWSYLDNPLDSAIQFDAYVEITRSRSMKRALSDFGKKLMDYAVDDKTDTGKDWSNVRTELTRTEALYNQYEAPKLNDSVTKLLKRVDMLMNHEESLVGIPTGFSNIDQLIGGFEKGELIVIGARPAMGKTGFMLSSVLLQLLRKQTSVAWFSLEQGTDQLINRVISFQSGVESMKIRSGNLSHKEYKEVYEVADVVKGLPLYIVDEAGIRMDRLVMHARKLRDLHGIQMIVIDYLQLVGTERTRRYDTRELQVAEICRSLKRLAMELKIPVVVLSQLSRSVETRGGDKKPILSDLRESGAIEQDADKVLFLYRAEYYGIDTDENGNGTKNIAEVILAKNRFGPVGSARLRFNSRLAKFESLDEVWEENEEEEEFLSPDEIPIDDVRLKEKFKRIFLNNDESEAKKFDAPF